MSALIDEDLFVISHVKGRWILDSRGNPTVEAEVRTLGGGLGVAAVPAGASKGTHEAIELRDNSKEFHGRGVEKAVRNINDIISKELVGLDSREQKEIDNIMISLDGTPNKSRLGANAILAVSLAVAKAAANTYGLPLFQYLGGIYARTLPVPLMNIINGGKHAGNQLRIQEFLIAPAGTDTFKDALRIGSEVYHSLKSYLIEKYGKTAINVGDEGGFAPPMSQSVEALDAIVNAIKRTGYQPGKDVYLALDAAATDFYDREKDKYIIDGKELSRDELLEYYRNLVEQYPIVSIEDPFHEEDFEGFKIITEELKGIQIIGDDLFVTSISRLSKGIEMGAANALLLKVNQIGSLTEALEAAFKAFKNNYNVVVSHRSGETEDITISHIAVALNAGQIKTGAPARGERTAKYNELIRIEEFLGGSAFFPGERVFKKKW